MTFVFEQKEEEPKTSKHTGTTQRSKEEYELEDTQMTARIRATRFQGGLRGSGGFLGIRN